MNRIVVIVLMILSVGCNQEDILEEDTSEIENEMMVRNPEPRPNCDPYKCPRPMNPPEENL